MGGMAREILFVVPAATRVVYSYSGCDCKGLRYACLLLARMCLNCRIVETPAFVPFPKVLLQIRRYPMRSPFPVPTNRFAFREDAFVSKCGRRSSCSRAPPVCSDRTRVLLRLSVSGWRCEGRGSLLGKVMFGVGSVWSSVPEFGGEVLDLDGDWVGRCLR